MLWAELIKFLQPELYKNRVRTGRVKHEIISIAENGRQIFTFFLQVSYITVEISKKRFYALLRRYE